MNINGTLLVQMINFSLAYVILKNIIFIPILKYINAERIKSEQITNTITQLSELMVARKKIRQNRLEELQRYFSVTQPLMKQVLQPISIESKVEHPEKGEIKEFGKKLHTLLRGKFNLS